MAKIIKDITVGWSWVGDIEAIKGFNVALCKQGDTPLTATVIQAYSTINKASAVGTTISTSYKFSNVTIDTGITYEPWVQALYDGKDSDWIKTGGASVADDGINTLPIKSQVDAAATTAVWSSVSGAGRPADNATVGAPAGTYVGSTLAQNVESNAASGVTALSQLGSISRNVISTTAPSGSGLWINPSDSMGYYSAGSFKTYIKNNGDFRFNGNTTNYIQWSSASGTLDIRGKLLADDITAGTLDASKLTVTNLDAGSITAGTLSVERLSTFNANLLLNSRFDTDISNWAVVESYGSYVTPVWDATKKALKMTYNGGATGVAVGHRAVQVFPGETYILNLSVESSVLSSTGFYIRMMEQNGAPSDGYVTQVSRTNYTDLIPPSGQIKDGVNKYQLAYKVPAAITYITPAVYIWTPATSGITLWIDNVLLSKQVTSIVGDQITTGTIDASIVNVKNINADNINSGVVTGTTLQTATSGNRFVVSSSNNRAEFWNSTNIVSSMGLYDTGGGNYAHLYVNDSATNGYGLSIEKNGSYGVKAVIGNGNISNIGICGSAPDSFPNTNIGVWGAGYIGVLGNGGHYGVRGQGSSYAFYAQNGTGHNDAASYGPFTGSHDALMSDISMSTVGDIVCDKEIVARASISDTLSLVDLTENTKCKSVLGVIAKILPPDTGHIPTSIENDPNKEQILENRNRLIINAVGEGQINVCKDGGNISAGDYICSSSRPGKGMKQDDDLQHNYTVAKAREDCVWLDGEDDIRMIACTYHAG